MKNLILLSIVFLPIIMSNCERESNNVAHKITYHTTKFGGCNGQDFTLKRTSQDFPDTVVFSIIDDTLNVFVGVNYICCAPIKTVTNIVNDSLLMVISDTCSYPYQSCYCRCNCYYTFDFQFVNFEEKVYNFQILLNDPRVDESIIFQTGQINPLNY